MTVPIIYVAGRFRGATAWDVEVNVRRAEEVALEVARGGAMPLTPHANTRFFHGQLDDGFWLAGTLALLRRCDAVVLVPGNWEGSTGTAAEVAEAARVGIPVLRPPTLGEAAREVARFVRLRASAADHPEPGPTPAEVAAFVDGVRRGIDPKVPK